MELFQNLKVVGFFSLERLNNIASSDIQDDKLKNITAATSFCRLKDLRQAFQSIKRLLLTERETCPALCSVLTDSFSLEVFQDGGSDRALAL